MGVGTTEAREAPSTSPDQAREHLFGHLTWWARAALAVAGGLALWLAFPDHNLPTAPIGVALSALALWGARPLAGAGLGFLTGLGCFVPVLNWTGIYVGAFPWLALAVVQALYVAAMGALICWAQRPWIRAGRVLLAAAVIPAGWVLQELVRGSWPYGGFPWARLAFSQADSGLARYAFLGGAPLVTAAVAALGALLLILPIGTLRRGLAILAVGAAVIVTARLIPLPSDGPDVRIAMVQGNVPRAGLDFNAERRKVLDNHVVGSELVGEKGEDVDLVVWPENSSDIDPLRNPDAAEQVQRALRAVPAPLLIGAVLDEPLPEVSNASLLYREPGDTTPERYIKQHPVPFAEYVPHRDFYRMFSQKVDLVRAGFAKGDHPVSYRLGSPNGEWAAIPTICFEVAYDGLMRDSTRAAGDLPSVLIVQTNNATFGYTAESTQQFAISRIRAIEHGRSVAHVSTVGVSGLIGPDGTHTPLTGLFTAEQVVGTVQARAPLSPSDRLGPWVEIVATLGLLALVARRSWRRRPVSWAVKTPAGRASAPTN
ncbi:apolipoprotein N-acyltransferase [Janibacter sp. GXQ6167]|uniref:apolipoprotein N-acyltransferase n=1 Tax=Janibacter sp. GXQ6167 TaxID=3240791 RepID=UPI003525D168